MARPISGLSDAQREVVKRPGNLLITACPGSGKTTLAAARVTHLASKGKRVAVCSYTNAGVDELGRNVGPEGHDPAHFHGTLHQFLLTYVLYPFGHLATGAKSGHKLLPPGSKLWPTYPVDGDNKKRVSVGNFHFLPDGRFRVSGTKSPSLATAAERQGANFATREKMRLARLGLLSFSDCMYWAYVVLRDHESLRSNLARRFDEILIDEAQDTSDVQVACLELIHGTGELRSLVLVGDSDQSIYGFQGAVPEASQRMADQLGLEQVLLSENYRSSQLICNVTGNFRQSRLTERAVGPHKDEAIVPEIIPYANNDETQAIKRFTERIGELGCTTNSSVILARTNAQVDSLNRYARSGCTPTVQGVGETTLAFVNGALDPQAMQALDRLVASWAWGDDRAPLTDEDRHKVRRASIAILRSAPSPDLALGEWIVEFRVQAQRILATLSPKPASLSRVFQQTQQLQAISAREAFATRSGNARTVHSVKGQTHDSVLLISGTGTGRRNDVDLWTRHLKGENLPLEDQEYLRIAFVGMTRARKYLALALPEQALNGAGDVWSAAGFRVLT